MMQGASGRKDELYSLLSRATTQIDRRHPCTSQHRETPGQAGEAKAKAATGAHVSDLKGNFISNPHKSVALIGIVM